MNKFELNVNEKFLLDTYRESEGELYIYGSALREYFDGAENNSFRKNIKFITNVPLNDFEKYEYDIIKENEKTYIQKYNWKREILFAENIEEYLKQNEFSINQILYDGENIKFGKKTLSNIKEKNIDEDELKNLSSLKKIEYLDLICKGRYNKEWGIFNSNIIDFMFIDTFSKEILRTILNGLTLFPKYLLNLFYGGEGAFRPYIFGSILNTAFRINCSNIADVCRVITRDKYSNYGLRNYKCIEMLKDYNNVILLTGIYYFNDLSLSENLEIIDDNLLGVVSKEEIKLIKKTLARIENVSSMDFISLNMPTIEMLILNIVYKCICCVKNNITEYKDCVENLRLISDTMN